MTLKRRKPQTKAQSNFKSFDKDSKFIAEKRKVLKLLSNSTRPLTALHISIITDIRIQNVTRVVGKLKHQNLIKVAYLGKCSISKYNNVQFLTVNK